MRLPRLRPSALSAEQAAVYRAITSGPRSAGPQMFRLRDSDGCLEGPFNLMLYSPAAGLALQDLIECLAAQAKLTSLSLRWSVRRWPMAGSATKRTRPRWQLSGRGALWNWCF